MDSDIIVALATPPGESALAILRISGAGSVSFVEEYSGLEKGRLSGMRRVLAEIPCSFEGTQAMIISWPGGKSFTGEEMVEIMIPGSMRIAGEMMTGLRELGARQAAPGEFTRRAFLSGRMSALQVIGLSSIWSGSGGRTGEGVLVESARKLEQALTILLENLEAFIEFSEEHQLDEVSMDFDSAMSAAAEFVEAAENAESPPRIFLMGPVNAGKSTLFNSLSGIERVVVSDRPGTTRDCVSGKVRVNGRVIELFDTPGFAGEAGAERNYTDERALEIVQGMLGKADVVIWMSPGGRDDPPDSILGRAGRTISISSRADEIPGSGMRVSAFTGEGVEDLAGMITGNLADGLVASRAAGMARLLEHGRKMLAAGEAAAASVEMTEVLEEIGSILDSGRGVALAVERALGRMCVGK